MKKTAAVLFGLTLLCGCASTSSVNERSEPAQEKTQQTEKKSEPAEAADSDFRSAKLVNIEKTQAQDQNQEESSLLHTIGIFAGDGNYETVEIYGTEETEPADKVVVELSMYCSNAAEVTQEDLDDQNVTEAERTGIPAERIKNEIRGENNVVTYDIRKWDELTNMFGIMDDAELIRSDRVRNLVDGFVLLDNSQTLDGQPVTNETRDQIIDRIMNHPTKEDKDTTGYSSDPNKLSANADGPAETNNPEFAKDMDFINKFMDENKELLASMQTMTQQEQNKVKSDNPQFNEDGTTARQLLDHWCNKYETLSAQDYERAVSTLLRWEQEVAQEADEQGN